MPGTRPFSPSNYQWWYSHHPMITRVIRTLIYGKGPITQSVHVYPSHTTYVSHTVVHSEQIGLCQEEIGGINTVAHSTIDFKGPTIAIRILMSDSWNAFPYILGLGSDIIWEKFVWSLFALIPVRGVIHLVPGSSFGLNLVLNIEQYEYIAGGNTDAGVKVRTVVAIKILKLRECYIMTTKMLLSLPYATNGESIEAWINQPMNAFRTISMAQCKTAVTALLTHWS